MAKKKKSPSNHKMEAPKKKDSPKKKTKPDKGAELPLLIVPEGATLKEIYAEVRRQFTAADLQKYTEDEPMVPMQQLIADMERIHDEEMKKKRRKR